MPTAPHISSYTCRILRAKLSTQFLECITLDRSVLGSRVRQNSCFPLHMAVSHSSSLVTCFLLEARNPQWHNIEPRGLCQAGRLSRYAEPRGPICVACLYCYAPSRELARASPRQPDQTAEDGPMAFATVVRQCMAHHQFVASTFLEPMCWFCYFFPCDVHVQRNGFRHLVCLEQ